MIRNHIKVLGINLNAKHVNEMIHFEKALQSGKACISSKNCKGGQLMLLNW